MTDLTRLSPYAPRPVGYGDRPATNGLAIAALVVVFFASVAGLVLGYIALSQIKQTGQGGRGLALAAVIVGWVGTLGPILVVGSIFVGSYVFRLY